MLYDYDKRVDELERIGRIPYDGLKERTLTRFIHQERALLAALTPPLDRSQALDAAQRKLAELLNPPELHTHLMPRLFG